jgi:hypothetical protein
MVCNKPGVHSIEFVFRCAIFMSMYNLPALGMMNTILDIRNNSAPLSIQTERRLQLKCVLNAVGSYLVGVLVVLLLYEVAYIAVCCQTETTLATSCVNQFYIEPVYVRNLENRGLFQRIAVCMSVMQVTSASIVLILCLSGMLLRDRQFDAPTVELPEVELPAMEPESEPVRPNETECISMGIPIQDSLIMTPRRGSSAVQSNLLEVYERGFYAGVAMRQSVSGYSV